MKKRFLWFALLSCVIAGWSLGQTASNTTRVYFVDGGSLEVVSIDVQGDRATLSLPDGGKLGIPASRVLRVEGPGQVGGRKPTTPDSSSMTAKSTGPAVAAVPSSKPSDEVQADGAEEDKPQSIEALIRSAAGRYDLDIELLAAVIAVESGFKPEAVSPKGAQGLMQLMPATARELDVTDPFDPRQNIDAGARYLRQLLDQHDGSFVKSLAAYNAGMGRVARYNGVPPYQETIKYIRRVLDKYEAAARR